MTVPPSRLGTPRPYLHLIEVRRDAIDELGHVNNVVYLRWVQEAITAFWRSAVQDVDAADIVWIAWRHEITYRRPAFEGERLSADVRATGYSGSRATFETRILRGGEVVAEADSTLCCLNQITRQLIRITPKLAQPFFERL